MAERIRPQLRPTCRVCGGTHHVPIYAGSTLTEPCQFCAENGRTKKVCPTCHEALPLCPCFGEYRGEVHA